MIIMTNEMPKKKHEISVGDQLIRWINSIFGKKYVIKNGSVIPDLTYCDKDHEITIEVTSAYYDGYAASIPWESFRKDRISQKSWQGHNFNESLIKNINKALIDKSQKQYGDNCLLAIFVYAPITTINKFNALIKEIVIPTNSFKGIFILFDNNIIELKTTDFLSGAHGS